ncbi:hypothetical protein CLV86_0286 [Lacinutrix venerupis]|uniref:Uncharacterized protein n=1 Tax=Lacinutrix venerupis TaxID=1486034 RepID=A0AAC9PX74_9FLAO|nr:hypothetical protein [Lacinutrix venerupis]APY00279.1 hypothetical protein BWR22_08120 [Lacinutrix venerupis]RLJ68897.1 hypothetical protein CLV86_0286 [Lacinutrix venerupis]
MKKLSYLFILMFSLSIFLTSCREEKKTPEENIEEVMEDVSDDIDNASDDVQDAIEDVQEEIEEVED